MAIGCERKSYVNQNTIDSIRHQNNHSADADIVPKTIVPFDSPERNYLLVEQAVDAWLYFNLSDYKSYEPLIRSTDYDSARNLYIHHLRLRTMNKQGGMETYDRLFEIDMTRHGENGNPFHVREIKH